MKFKCARCKTQYKVTDDKIPPGGAKIRCRICKYVFIIHPPKQQQISTQYETYSNEPLVVFTPDIKTLKRIEKLLHKTDFQATFLNTFKDVQAYFREDKPVDTSTPFQQISGQYPPHFHPEHPDVHPGYYHQHPVINPNIRPHIPHQPNNEEYSNGLFQETTQSIEQDYHHVDPGDYENHEFSDQASNATNEFDFHRKNSATVFSENIYRQFDTPLTGPEDGPVIENTIDQNVSEMRGPMGLDIGTSHIVIAGMSHDQLSFKNNLNAFFAVPASEVTKKTLKTKSIPFFVRDRKIYVCGYAAQNFANIFNTSLRRPIEKGLLSPKEEDGFTVIRAILEKIVPKASKENEEIAFSIPGAPLNVVGAVTYHSSVITKYLKEFGYKPIPINEGFATVISELSDDAYTGIGISMGGGMCNICLAYMAVPIIHYSIQVGGDYIDEMVSKSVGESSSKVKMIKENHLNLNQTTAGRISTAFSIFYDELIGMVIDSFSQVLDTTSKIPRISKALPIIVSGGTAMPEGFEKRFATALENKPLPLRISEVRIAEDPLHTTAKGAMTMAVSGGDIFPGGHNE